MEPGVDEGGDVTYSETGATRQAVKVGYFVLYHGGCETFGIMMQKYRLDNWGRGWRFIFISVCSRCIHILTLRVYLHSTDVCKQVYSPPLYHYNHSSAGPVMANLLRSSPCSSLVEMVRIAALGGGRVSSRRFNSASTKLRDVERLASSVVSGLGSRSGSMRIEGSYSVPTGESLPGAIAAAVKDNFRQVVGYDDRGWACLAETFFAVSAEDVSLLAKAGIDRSVAAMKTGLDASGQTVGEALPIGHVPSVGEILLQLEGKAFRRVVVGRMLLDGLRRFGYVGEYS